MLGSFICFLISVNFVFFFLYFQLFSCLMGLSTILILSQFPFPQGLRNNNYAVDPLLQSCGISISNQFTQVDGHVLAPPKVCTKHAQLFSAQSFSFFQWICLCICIFVGYQLKVGNGADFCPRNGRWNFNNKVLFFFQSQFYCF